MWNRPDGPEADRSQSLKRASPGFALVAPRLLNELNSDAKMSRSCQHEHDVPCYNNKHIINNSSNMKNITSIIFVVSVLFIRSEAGPITCGACYTACNAGYVSCMASSGLGAGTTGPVGWWAWLTSAAAGCSAIQGACMATCAASAAAPTP